MHHINIKAVALSAAVALGVGGVASATADAPISGAKLKNGSVTSVKLSHGLNARAARVERRLAALEASVRDLGGKLPVNGTNGQQGAKGERGEQGLPGITGTPGPTGATGANGLPGAPGTNGSNGGLPNGFFVTNKSVGLTASGVDFGPYDDGGAAGGSLYFNGFNGQKLGDLTDLAFTVEHTTGDGSPISVPYMRVFLNGNVTDVVLDPTECATKVPAEGQANAFSTADTTVRYDDDPCGPDAHQLSFADAVAAHGDDVISGIYVTTGFSGGADLHAKLTSVTINGVTTTFGG